MACIVRTSAQSGGTGLTYGLSAALFQGAYCSDARTLGSHCSGEEGKEQSDQRTRLVKNAWEQESISAISYQFSSLIDPFYFPFTEQERPCSLAHQWPLKVSY